MAAKGAQAVVASGHELRLAITQGAVSVQQLQQEIHSRYETSKDWNAFVTFVGYSTPDSASASAEGKEAEVSGLLAGIPFVVSSNIDVNNAPTTLS